MTFFYWKAANTRNVLKALVEGNWTTCYPWRCLAFHPKGFKDNKKSSCLQLKLLRRPWPGWLRVLHLIHTHAGSHNSMYLGRAAAEQTKRVKQRYLIRSTARSGLQQWHTLQATIVGSQNCEKTKLFGVQNLCSLVGGWGSRCCEKQYQTTENVM